MRVVKARYGRRKSPHVGRNRLPSTDSIHKTALEAILKILVISDVHSNYTALKAVISREAPFDFVICVGDLIFGGPQPNEVVSALSKFSGYFVFYTSALFGATS